MKQIPLYMLMCVIIGCTGREHNQSETSSTKRNTTTTQTPTANNKQRNISPLVKFKPEVSFNEYKVGVQTIKAELNFSPLYKSFKTVISNAYKKNDCLFAGHYSFIWWRCGMPCQCGVMVDRRTGRIYDIPVASYGYQFEKDSRMLIVNPPDSNGYYENIPECTPEVYVLNEHTKAFTLVDITKK